tara:strand:+ start:364 stop:555 length:192 start_codon:yes stop_codon:yes gene_type:complete
MIRTKFKTESWDELFALYNEFETKLEMWSEKNINCTWDLQVLIGDHEYTIIVTVEDESDKETE